MAEQSNPQLRRLRLELENHDADLLLVGDSFESGGRYAQLEVPRAVSHAWTWLDWDAAYDRLTREWVTRFAAVRRKEDATT